MNPLWRHGSASAVAFGLGYGWRRLTGECVPRLVAVAFVAGRFSVLVSLRRRACRVLGVEGREREGHTSPVEG